MVKAVACQLLLFIAPGVFWPGSGSLESRMFRVRASQKLFTDVEVATLFGVALEEVRELARLKHLGCLARAAEAAGASAGQLLFSLSDLMILSVLWPRFQH